MKKILMLLLLTILVFSCTQSTKTETDSSITESTGNNTVAFKPANIEEELQYYHAIEATIWGVPAVSMASIRQSLKRDLDANFDDIVYFSKVLDSKHELLTANNQTDSRGFQFTIRK